jgi:hypothetical protein
MDECPYGCFNIFIGGEMVPFECPLQSTEVEVAGHQVGTVGGVVQALLTKGENMVDRCCCCVGTHIVLQKDDSCCEKAGSLLSNGIFESCQCLAVAFGIDGSPLSSPLSHSRKSNKRIPSAS